MSVKLAEFDEYADGYDGGMDDPLKRAFGDCLDQFLMVKVRWMLARVPGRANDLLDFGCGSGDFLKLLRREQFAGALTGADVSRGMLDEAKRKWADGAVPAFLPLADGSSNLADDSYDVAVACCVFHHIPPGERPTAARALARTLRPGGRLFVFEHNPWNPLTRLIVARAPIDRDAILLSARSCVRLLAGAGFTNVRATYLLFAPPKYRWSGPLDRRLGRLPFGGQYVVTADVPAERALVATAA